MPVRSEILPVTRRKVMSPIPPAAKGRKTRIGLVGYCACAGNAVRNPAATSIATAATRRHGKEREVKCIEFPPVFILPTLVFPGYDNGRSSESSGRILIRRPNGAANSCSRPGQIQAAERRRADAPAGRVV